MDWTGGNEMHLTHQNAKRVRDCRMRSQRAQPTTRSNHPFLYISCTQNGFRISHCTLKDLIPCLSLFLLGEWFLSAEERKRKCDIHYDYVYTDRFTPKL